MAGLINFEDENEVKQFLDNLGMEYSFQCYKEKDPEGNIYLRRTTVLKPRARATKNIQYIMNEFCRNDPIFLLCFRVPKTGRLFGRSKKEL